MHFTNEWGSRIGTRWPEYQTDFQNIKLVKTTINIVGEDNAKSSQSKESAIYHSIQVSIGAKFCRSRKFDKRSGTEWPSGFHVSELLFFWPLRILLSIFRWAGMNIMHTNSELALHIIWSVSQKMPFKCKNSYSKLRRNPQRIKIDSISSYEVLGNLSLLLSPTTNKYLL